MIPAKTYDRGDMVRISATFTDADGAAADPTTVTLRLRQPDNTVTVYAAPDVVSEGAGVYHCDFEVTQQGRHFYRWEGTGAVKAAGEGEFLARESKVLE